MSPFGAPRASEHVAHGAHRARGAERRIPLGPPEPRHHGLELELGRGTRPLEPLLGDVTVGEVGGGHADAAHVEALEPPGSETFADDQLGAAAADVDHQPMAAFARRRVRNAEVDEARFLDAGDDLDRVAERLARAVEERALAPRLAQRVGADDADSLGLHVVQPLPEALEAGERTAGGVAVQSILVVEAGCETDGLAQAVDDRDLAVRVTADDHVEAVGPEVDSRQDVGHGSLGTGQARVRPRTRSRSRRWSSRSGCGSRTARPRGLPCSRSRRPRGTGSSSGRSAA